jgi:hypothetical protein
MPPRARNAYSGGDGDDDDDQAAKLAGDEQITACPDRLDRLGACGRLRDASAFLPAARTHMAAGSRAALRANHVAGFFLPALALELSEGTALVRVCILISHVSRAHSRRSRTLAEPTSRAEQQRSSREPQAPGQSPAPTSHCHDTRRSTALARRRPDTKTP